MFEYRFRCWDRKNKKMVYLQKEHLDYYPNGALVLPLDCDIMLTTNSYDMNGREIYQGDVLAHHKNSNHRRVVWFGEYENWDAEYVEHKMLGFYEAYKDDYYADVIQTYPFDNPLGWYVIIGNIFENPEMDIGVR